MAFGQDYHQQKKDRVRFYLKMVNEFIYQLELEAPHETLNEVELQAFQIVNEYYLSKIDELSGLTSITQVLNKYYLGTSTQKIKAIPPTVRRGGKTNKYRRINFKDGKQ